MIYVRFQPCRSHRQEAIFVKNDILERLLMFVKLLPVILLVLKQAERPVTLMTALTPGIQAEDELLIDGRREVI